MFDVDFSDMKHTICIEDGMYQILTASNVGISPDLIFCGDHEYTSAEAIIVIAAIDRAAIKCPKYLYKRILSQRGSFINAFGPEMIQRTTPAPVRGK